MSYDLLDHVDQANDAWEHGHSLLVHIANGILKDNGVLVVVEEPHFDMPKDPARSLRDSYLTLIKHLGPLEPYLDDLLLLKDIQPWKLGDIEILHWLKRLMDKTRYSTSVLDDLKKHAGQSSWEPPRCQS